MKLPDVQIIPYLPYGLNIINHLGKHIELTISDYTYHKEKGFKPILRPLEDIGKKCDDYKVKSYLVALCKESGLSIDSDLDIDSDHLVYIEFNQYHIVSNFLYKYHFDVFGLIEKGLAIDINTINT